MAQTQITTPKMSQPFLITTDTHRINVRVEGSGPPLLFLGGSNFDLSIKAPVFDSILPQHFTVAAFDPRGLGGTDAPDGDWSMQDYAHDAMQVMDALEWRSANILGESFGAMTALHLAGLAPRNIKRLALAAGSPGGVGGSSYPVQELLDIKDPYTRARKALSIMDTRFTDRMNSSAAEATLEIKARIEVEKTFMASHNNASGYPRLLTARANHDATQILPDILCDTLIFAGRYDQQAPLDRSEYMADNIPNSRLHIIEGGHAHCFANPEPVNILVNSWCNDTA